MRIGLDTNVLVYAHVASFDAHGAVRHRLTGWLKDPEVVVVVTPLVLHELVHVITDARRFDPPVSMSEASAIARQYLGRRNVECVPVGERAMIGALDLLERNRLGRRRVADALLASTLIDAGIDMLATCDGSDFAVFEGLTVIDPRQA